jgi:hypothetical protein
MRGDQVAAFSDNLIGILDELIRRPGSPMSWLVSPSIPSKN